jgi:hypothetical protein
LSIILRNQALAIPVFNGIFLPDFSNIKPEKRNGKI